MAFLSGVMRIDSGGVLAGTGALGTTQGPGPFVLLNNGTSRFTDMTRQAASYRKGRVLLAGDAAHVHYPVGGQGLQLGVQDAVNLGWKLAQVANGASPESLLDTYHAEQHPVGARVLRSTMAQTALTRSGARIDALRETMSELLSMDEPRKLYGARMSAAWTSTMTSAKGTRCSGAACPIST